MKECTPYVGYLSQYPGCRTGGTQAPHLLGKHGDKRVDDYYWLRNKQDPAVLNYMQAENAYAEAVTESLKPFEDTLYREMVGRIQETDLSVPYRLHGWFYYSRTEAGKQYPILCRQARRRGRSMPEHILLDVEQAGSGQVLHGNWRCGAERG